MGRILLLAIVGLVAALAVPTTRPAVLEKAAPLLLPFYKWQTAGEMEEIAREISSFERTYFKLPTSRSDFGRWMGRTFVDETARDTWDSKYEFRSWPDSFAVFSPGPDRTMDTDDDIRRLKLRVTALRERAQGR